MCFIQNWVTTLRWMFYLAKWIIIVFSLSSKTFLDVLTFEYQNKGKRCNCFETVFKFWSRRSNLQPTNNMKHTLSKVYLCKYTKEDFRVKKIKTIVRVVIFSFGPIMCSRYMPIHPAIINASTSHPPCSAGCKLHIR